MYHMYCLSDLWNPFYQIALLSSVQINFLITVNLFGTNTHKYIQINFVSINYAGQGCCK